MSGYHDGDVCGIEYSVLAANHHKALAGDLMIESDLAYKVIPQLTAKLAPRLRDELGKHTAGRVRVYITARVEHIPEAAP